MERAAERQPDLGVAVPAEVDHGALGREQVERALQPGRRRAGVDDQVAAAGGVGRQREVDAERGRDRGPAGIDVDERDLHAGNRRSRRATQQPTIPAPTTATRSPTSGAASQRALTAVSTVPASTARAGGTSVGHDGHGAGRHDVGGLVRVEAEDRAAAQLGRPLLHGADVEVAVLDRPRESPSWNGARIAAYWSGGTPPRKTSVSVPRLTPERMVRTSTSSGPGSGSATGRISPRPGARSQNACAIP